MKHSTVLVRLVLLAICLVFVGARSASGADVLVNMTPTPTTVIAGANVTYTIRIDNNALDDAGSVVLTSVVPAGAIFVSVTPPPGVTCTYPVPGTCALGTIPGGGSRTIDLVLKSNSPGALTNTASVATTSPDVNPSNNSTTKTVTVVAGADLTASKTGSPNPVVAGNTITYTITTQNLGPQGATAITVTDTLPPSTTFLSATGTGWTCTASAQVVTCSRPGPAGVGPLPNITLQARPQVNGTITNTVTIQSAVGDPQPNNNTTTYDATVLPGADMSVTKTVSPNPAATGAQVSWTVTPRNNGPMATTNVTMSDPLPAGLTFVSVTPTSNCSYDSVANAVNCLFPGPVASGTNLPAVVITTTVNQSGTIANTATVASAVSDPTSSNNSVTRNLTVQAVGSDLAASKTVSPAIVAVGSNMTYSVTVRNAGPSIVPNAGVLSVTDVLPAGVTYISSGGNGWTCAYDNPTRTVTCTRPGPLALNATTPAAPIVVRADVAGAIANTACASATGTAGDPTPGNNCSGTSSSSTSAVADLAITKSGAPGSVQGGFPLTYTMTVTNNGPDPATNVVMTDPVAASSVISATPSTGTCSVSGTAPNLTVTCSLGTMANGATATITLQIRPLNAPGTRNNTATVTSQVGDPVSANNSASATTTITAGVDLQTTKVASPNPLLQGSNVTFVITSRNNGPASATGVTLTDSLPANIRVISVTSSQGTCPTVPPLNTPLSSASSLTCNLGTLSAGSQQTVTIIAEPTAVGNYVNIATSSTPNQPDWNPANDASSANFTVNAAQVDVSVSKVDNLDPVAIGTNFNYLITVVNNGPSRANNVVLTENIPPQFTFVSISTPKGTCTGAGPVTCSFSDLANGESVLLTLTMTASTLGSFTNNASITASETDTNLLNNTTSEQTTAKQAADLSILKTGTPNPVRLNENITFTLTVNNAGPAVSVATNVVDTLPSGLTLLSVTPSQGTCPTANPINCTLGTLNNGSSATITVVARADSAGALSNSAAVSGSEPDTVTGNNTSTFPFLIVPVPDLTISKTHSGSFPLGGVGAFALTVQNNGGAPTDGSLVTVSDAMPAGYTPTAASGAGWACTVSAPNISCTRSDVLANGLSWPPVNVSVSVAANAAGSLSNTASVTGGGDNTPGNNASTDTVTNAPSPDPAITLSRSGAFIPGQDGTYLIGVSNPGVSPTSGLVTVSTTLPPGLTPTAATGAGWTCTISAQALNCSRSDVLASGGSYPPITLTVAIASNASGGISTTATVSGGGDTNPANNSSTDSVTFGAGADLSLAKASVGAFVLGQTGSYALTVTNSGGAASSGVVTVVDVLPAGLTPTAASGTGWTCSVVAPNISCTRADVLAPSQSYPPISVAVNIAANAASSITNTATVSGGADTNVANNQGSNTISIQPAPDLSITKSATGPLVAGQSASYAITVSNSGLSASSGVVTVSDTLPLALTPSAATGTGWTCSINLQVVSCTRADALAAASAFPLITVISAVAPTASGNITNAALVSGGGDINSANNSASDTSSASSGADLTLLKTAGTFTLGQTGTYTLSVSNVGGSASSGTVTVADTIPASLTPLTATGTGWTCSITGQAVSCTRSDALAAAASYPSIAVTVNVPPTAPSTINNTATVSGGSDINSSNNQSSNSLNPQPAPDPAITLTRVGAFVPAQTASYTVGVTNAGVSSTSGLVTVTLTLPADLAPGVPTGAGWTCNVVAQTVTCTRSDVLANGASYPDITLPVTVAAVPAPVLTTTASVSGGGDINAANNTSSDTGNVGAGTDLTILKTASTPFIQGQTATYTIVVTNNGGAASSGLVTVSDPIPGALTTTSALGSGWSCSFGALNVSCTRSDVLAVGQSYPPITIVADIVGAPPTVNNTATVSGGSDANAANNTSSVVSPVLAAPDLLISKARVGTLIPGQSGAYTLTVSNIGVGSTSGAVTVNDILAPAFTATAASGPGWACTILGQNVGCTRSDVLASAAAFPAITVSVDVAPTASGLVTNIATVSGGADNNPANNSSSDSFTFGTGADLSLLKTAVGVFVQGQAAAFNLLVSNSGGAATTGLVTVSDTMPVGLTPVSASGGGWTCNVSGQLVSCTRSDVLASGGSYPPISVAVNIASNASPSLANTATVSGGADTNAGNNASTANVAVTAAPDPTITISRGGAFVPGQSGVYTLDVQNVGAGPTFGPLTVSTTLPPGLTPTTATGTGWTCNIVAQVLTCTQAGVLAPGASQSPITLNVAVAAGATGSIATTATVSGGGDINAANNAATDSVSLGSGVDLTLSKTAAGVFVQGQPGNYTLGASNIGGAATSGLVTVSDTLPVAMTPVSAAGAGWTCGIAAQTVTCSRSDALAAGQSYPSISLTANISAGAPSSLTNIATVSGGADTNVVNNQATATTAVLTAPDLSLTKTVVGPLLRGQPGTYSLNVANSGGASSAGTVTVGDTLPTGLTPTAATGSGWTCTVVAPAVSCTRSDAVAAGQSFPVITLSVLVAANAPASVSNTATVSGGGDLNPANNSGNATVSPVSPPDPAITLSRVGPLVPGQSGSFTIGVNNVGIGPTTSAVTVVTTFPTGLAPAAASGPGWTCSVSGQTVTCSRADAVASGAAYPAVDVTVAVATNASGVLTTIASVSGGGDVNAANNNATDVSTVGSGADLTIAKSAVGAFVQGQSGRFTLQVSNNGGAASSGLVTVTDSLPSGLAPSSASGTGWTCSVSGQNVTCSRSDALAATQSYPAITVIASIASNAPTALTNAATVSGGADVNPSNDQASALVTIQAAPDVTISKTRGGPLVRGQNGTYRLTVTNVGAGATSAPISVTDVLPTGLSALSATGAGWTCTVLNPNVTCTRPDVLAAGAAYPVITITVGVAVNAPGTITNTATVSGGGPDLQNGNNTDSDTAATGAGTDLTVDKVSLGSFVQGQNGTFRITVSNVGGADSAGAITVTDTLAAGLTPTAASGLGWSCSITGPTVTCTRADALASAGSFAPIDLTVAIGIGAPPSVTNTAAVSGGSDANAGNNQSSATVNIQGGPDLSLVKTSTAIFRGSPATFTLAVTNVGGFATSGVVTVTDVVPAGITLTTATGSGWACSIAGQTVTCSRSDALAPTTAYPSIAITGSVSSAAPVSITNTATVSVPGDTNAGNNSGTLTSTVQPAPDLTMTKVRIGPLSLGAPGTYLLTVSNVGSGPTFAPVTVTDTIAAGVTPTAAVGPGWTCSIAAQNVSCNRADALNSGNAYPPITLSVLVGVGAPPSITNTATVSGGGADLNPGNNSATDTVTVGAGADLSIVKTSLGTFVQGQTASYSLVVTNSGGGATSGFVTVSDAVPAALVPTGASGAGWTCSVVAQNVSCTRSDVLASGQSYPSILVNVSVPLSSLGNTSNTATVSGGGDTNAGNNSSTANVNVLPGGDLSITKAFQGTFFRGQAASYLLTVANVGGSPITGLVTVADTLPTGLSPAAVTGIGWTCNTLGQTVTCTRSDALAAGAAYPGITLTVLVDALAPLSVTNSATVSNASDINPGNDSGSTSLVVQPAPDLTISKSRQAPFAQGQNGDYFLSVTNLGSGPTFAPVTVADVVPAGLTPVSAAGPGWSCGIAAQIVTCTRADALASGSTYPDVVLTVAVSPSASGSLLNAADVSGGGVDLNTGNNSATDTVIPGGGTDLVISKVAVGPFVRGQAATYQLSVSNTGGASSTGLITVTDVLPAALTPAAAAGVGWTCTIGGQNVSCTRADALNVAQTFPPIVLTVNVAGGAPGPLLNTATVSGGADTNPGNNSSTASVNPLNGLDLTLSKTHSGLFSAGQPGQYLLTVTNVGGIDNAGAPVTVVDTVPSEMVATSALGDGWICSIDAAIVTCSRSDTLGATDAFPPITLTVRVGPNPPPTVINRAMVSVSGDINAGNDTALDGVDIAPDPNTPDLTIQKAHQGSIVAGSSAVYLIAVRNIGLGASSGLVTVSDGLPTGLVPTSASGIGWSCQIAGYAVTCTRSDSLAGQAEWPPIQIVSSAVTAAGPLVSNTAFVSGGGDVKGSNNSSTDTTLVLVGPDLTIAKQLNSTLVRGAVATYALNVSNGGGVATSGTVKVTDTIPAGLVPLSAAGPGWLCTLTDRTFGCTRSDVLAPGTAYPSIVVTATVALDAPATLTNTATLEGGGDANPGNNSGSATGTVSGVAPPDLSITKQSQGPFVLGGTGTYLLLVSNASTGGPTTGTITVTDDVPTGLTPTAVTGVGWSCAIAVQRVTCSRSDVLAAGQSYPPITLSVAVAANAPASIRNIGEVTGGGDTTPTNNNGPSVTPTQQRPDLTLSKSHTGELVRGSNAEFQLFVRNAGAGPTVGEVTVTDTLPAGLAPIAAVGDGWTCSTSGSTFTCRRSSVLESGKSYPVITIRVAVSPDAPSSVINEGEVTGGGDNTPENNKGSDTADVRGATPDVDIQKSVDRPVAQLGDVLTYRIEVRNKTNIPILEGEVRDKPPAEFYFVPGSARVVVGLGAPQLVEPSNSGGVLTFPVPTLQAFDRIAITYRVRVGLRVRPGSGINVASFQGRASGGRFVATQEARAEVRIEAGVFATRQFILGRVFEDANANGLFDDGERPVAGARLLLSNGQSATTDTEGMYSIPSVGEGAFTIAVDPVTLPASYGLQNGGQRAGESWSRLLRTPLGNGTLLRQNFALRPVRKEAEDAAVSFYEAAKDVEYQRREPGAPPLPSSAADVRAAASSAAPSVGALGDRVASIQIVPERSTVESGGRQSVLLSIRAFDKDGHPIDKGDVELATSLGQFLVPVEGACLSGEASARCAGPMAGATTTGVGGGGVALAGVSFRPLDTGVRHETVGLVGNNVQATAGLTAAQIPDTLEQVVVALEKGEAHVRLLSGDAPGQALVRAHMDALDGETAVQFVPENRPPVLVGFGELSVGRAAPEFGLFNQSGRLHQRAEFFYRDTVREKNTFTLAYSSARPLNRSAGSDRLFQLDPAMDREYPIFGDSSTRLEYAQSNSKFFGKWERGRSHLLFGDMRSDLANSSRSGLTDVQRNLTGVRVHLEGENGKLVLRGARPDTGFARDVFPGYTYGLLRLSRQNVLEGSETITLERRDRRNPDLILDRETLIRNVDYNFDWLGGSIFFLRQVSALDAALNLTQVVVTYEYRSASGNTWFYAFSGETRLAGAGLDLGFNFLTQREKGIGAYYLGGVTARQKLPAGGYLRIETPLSRGDAFVAGSAFVDGGQQNRDGYAIRAELEQPLGGRSSSWHDTVLKAAFSRAEANFLNPFGATTVPGTTRSNAAVETRLLRTVKLKGGVTDELNRTAQVHNDRKSVSFNLAWPFLEHLELTAGYDWRRLNDDRIRTRTNSNLLTGALDWRVTSRLQAGVRREQNLTDADPTYPDQTLLKAGFDLNAATRLFFTQRLASAPIVPIEDLSHAGFASIQSRRETSFGVETRLRRWTTLGAKYQVENGINGPDAFAVLGVVNRIPAGKKAGLDLSFERGFAIDDKTPSFLAGGFGGLWQPKESVRTTGRYEVRNRNGVGHIVSTGVAGRLASGWTALATAQYAKTAFTGQQSRATSGTAAFAWRPLESDRYGVLFSYNVRDLDGRTFQLNVAQKERIGILSTDAYVQPLREVEIYGRVGWSNRVFRFDDTPEIGTNTFLYQGRAQLHFVRYFDLAGEARVLSQPVTRSRRTAAGAELGAWPIRDFRAALGYNFKASESVGTNFLLPNQRKGFYFSLSTKLSSFFDLFGTPDAGLQKEEEPKRLTK